MRDQVRVLGVILLVSTFLYAFPPTAALGAILITGYLGGAIAVNLLHHRPLASHMLFGVYIALFVWGRLVSALAVDPRTPAIRAGIERFEIKEVTHDSTRLSALRTAGASSNPLPMTSGSWTDRRSAFASAFCGFRFRRG